MKRIIIGVLVLTVVVFTLFSTFQVFALTQVTNAQMLDMCSQACDYMTTYSKVPSTITVDTDSVTAAEFYYMMARWLRWYKNNSAPPNTVSIIRGTLGPASPSGIESGSISKTNLLSSGLSNADYIDANSILPNYSTINGTQYSTKAMFSVFARAMKYYHDRNRLANSTTVTAIGEPDSWTGGGTPTPTPTNTPTPTPTPGGATPTPTPVPNSWAFWITGTDARNYGVSTVANESHNNGVTDIFLIVKGGDGTYRFDTLDDMINAAHPLGIRVHAWVIVLSDATAQANGYTMSGTNWVDARDNNYKNYIIDNIITPLCTGHNMDGIHLDCIRYPGNAYQYAGGEAAITGYCSSIRTVMNNNGKSAIPLTAAIMPEGSSDPYYYGQNVANMSPYLGSIQLMTYTHNYGTQPSWVGQQVAYFLTQCAAGCTVWAGIQTRFDDGGYMTTTEMNDCISSAMSNGSSGIICFRYPLSDSQWTCLNSWTP